MDHRVRSYSDIQDFIQDLFPDIQEFIQDFCILHKNIIR